MRSKGSLLRISRSVIPVVGILVCVLLATNGPSIPTGLAPALAQSRQDLTQSTSEASQASNGHNVFLPLIVRTAKTYLPLILRNYPASPSSVGTEMQEIVPSDGLSLAVGAGIRWVRFGAFAWDQIEPVRTEPPTYHWDVVDEVSLGNADANRLKVVAIIRFTPDWAQKAPGLYCGPIQQDKLDEFGQFLTALVTRYSAAPYNVHYWELGNEPDVDPSLVDPHSLYGCWGDPSDTYFGGGYYAEMLKVAYPAIKAADPNAQVLIGGLLLPCDPTIPLNSADPLTSGSGDISPDSNCQSANFLEGILKNSGGPYFDIVSFHGYPKYDGTLQQDLNYANWGARGGVVLGKVDFLREVLTRYGVDKGIMHTEGSLLCPKSDPTLCDPPDNGFYETQADYVAWLFVRNWAAGVQATIWYPFEGPGWLYGGLLDENQNPKPAYRALDFLTMELSGTQYVGLVSQYPELQGYEFAAPGKHVWVLWAPDEQPRTISLPTGTIRVYDKYGSDITPPEGTISVSNPIYLELVP